MSKRKYIINYKFDPAPDGSLYELKTARLVVKARTKKDAMQIGYKWLDQCWKFYKVSIKPAPKDSEGK